MHDHFEFSKLDFELLSIEKGSLQPSMEDEAQWKFLPRALVLDGTPKMDSQVQHRTVIIIIIAMLTAELICEAGILAGEMKERFSVEGEEEVSSLKI